MIRPILEYRSVSWDPCRGQINALDLVQKKASQFTNYTKDSNWQTLAQRRTIARCVLWGMGLESNTRQVAKALLFV